jgi:hypothetical protein
MGSKLRRKADNHVPQQPVSYLRRTVLDVSKTDVSKETSEPVTQWRSIVFQEIGILNFTAVKRQN